MSVSYGFRDGIAVLWLSDPARRKALSRAIVFGAFAALSRSREDNARAIVLAGRGTAPGTARGCRSAGIELRR
jgi:enoyl-CoA hydratase/carnithine racemase